MKVEDGQSFKDNFVPVDLDTLANGPISLGFESTEFRGTHLPQAIRFLIPDEVKERHFDPKLAYLNLFDNGEVFPLTLATKHRDYGEFNLAAGNIVLEDRKGKTVHWVSFGGKGIIKPAYLSEQGNQITYSPAPYDADSLIITLGSGDKAPTLYLGSPDSAHQALAQLAAGYLACQAAEYRAAGTEALHRLWASQNEKGPEVLYGEALNYAESSPTGRLIPGFSELIKKEKTRLQG